MKIGGDHLRLIDADALIEELNKLEVEMMHARLAHIATQVVVDEAPTIDAVPATIEGALGYLHKVGWMQEHDRIMTEGAAPVVRCKDCEYYHQAFCEIWSKYGTIQTREQGFCYMAERKER